VDGRVLSHSDPLFIAAVILLDHHRIAPGDAAVGRLVALDGNPAQGVGPQPGEIKIAVTVHVHHAVAESENAPGNGGHESAGPGLAAVGRVGKAGEENVNEMQRWRGG